MAIYRHLMCRKCNSDFFTDEEGSKCPNCGSGCSAYRESANKVDEKLSEGGTLKGGTSKHPNFVKYGN
jgi:uncharacterized Zn ribbon protein